MTDITQDDNNDADPHPFPSIKHREQLLATLRVLGIHSVTVEFSGSGDSGSIQDVYANNAANETIYIGNQNLLWPEERKLYNDKDDEWIIDNTVVITPLAKILERIAYDALDKCGLDWYNNDGGQGEFYIKFDGDKPKIGLDVGVNTMTTDYNFFEY